MKFLVLFLKFKDSIVFYDSSHSSSLLTVKKNYFKNNDELISNLDSYTFSGTNIYFNEVSDDVLKWCLNEIGDRSYLYHCGDEEYKKYGDNQ